MFYVVVGQLVCQLFANHGRRTEIIIDEVSRQVDREWQILLLRFSGLLIAVQNG